MSYETVPKRARRGLRKSQTPGLVGGRFTKQGDLLRRLLLTPHNREIAVPACPPESTLRRGLNEVRSRTPSGWSQ